MQSPTVKDIMVPLARYASVPETATLFEAVVALEKAQQEFDQTRYRHRAILVYDDQKKIVGKISQLTILKSLEPKYNGIKDTPSLSRLGYSRRFMQNMMAQYNLWNRPLDDICKKAATMKVKDFMYTPTEGEYIEEDATLNAGIHQLIIGHHQSLLVTKNKEIVGVLRVTDVFKEVSNRIKACGIE